MKKLFTLLALLACFLGANAKTVVDAFVDYSTMADCDASGIKFYGWGASDEAKARLSIKDGCLHFESSEVTLNPETGAEEGWRCQFHPIGGVSAQEGTVYTLHYKVKGDHNENISALGFGLTPYGQFPITTEWVEGTFEYEAASSSGDILFQCGSYIGTWDIAYLKITHEEEEGAVAQTWLQMLTNNGNPTAPEGDGKYMGDAEFGAWPAWALETVEGINANWRGDRTGEICAWALTMGRNFDDQNTTINEDSPRSRPYPADIEPEAGNESNHVFAVHVDKIEKIDADASIAWSNQFWIQSPQEWKAGTKVKIQFRYKADRAQRTETQIHKIHPSDYLFWNAVGDVNFTTEWQDFDKTIELSSDQANGVSLAFNLTPDAAPKSDTDATPKDAASLQPNVFYFDNLSWEVLKLDHGFFVAGKGASVAYDYSQAAQFTEEDENYYTVTIGTKGDKDSWVDEIQISTVRGDNSAFKGATLKPTKAIVLDADGVSDWLDYAESSNAKIKLPAAGVYAIELDSDMKQMRFEQLEGDAPVVKEPVAIVTNPTENVVNATERDWLPADKDGNPVEAEIGNGAAWDNQFWIAANRDLVTDEVTVLKFQYKASKVARTSTQAHKVGDDGKPCTYLNWQAIGDVNFTEEWQDFETTFTVPAGDNGMRSIVFNMAEIKEACDYYIKNVQWYLKDETLEAEGKTYENLINAEGAENFWIKVNSGAPTAIRSITSNAKIGSAVLYNLAGQRVSNSFKGIVVKDGKKYVK